MSIEDDKHWMQQAIILAQQAQSLSEVPIGAVLVSDEGAVLGEGWNQPIYRHDPCAHAEIIALRKAGQKRGNYRLLNTTLYTTLEPCVMCVGAIVHARIKRLVFGAFDPKAGAVSSVITLLDSPHFNHRLAWKGGVLADECGHKLRQFFAVKR